MHTAVHTTKRVSLQGPSKPAGGPDRRVTCSLPPASWSWGWLWCALANSRMKSAAAEVSLSTLSLLHDVPVCPPGCAPVKLPRTARPQQRGTCVPGCCRVYTHPQENGSSQQDCTPSTIPEPDFLTSSEASNLYKRREGKQEQSSQASPPSLKFLPCLASQKYGSSTSWGVAPHHPEFDLYGHGPYGF